MVEKYFGEPRQAKKVLHKNKPFRLIAISNGENNRSNTKSYPQCVFAGF